VAASKNPIHIIASTESLRICGTKSQPYIIEEAPFGQKLYINGLSFTMANSDHSTKFCYKYGVIVDRLGKTNSSICGGGLPREKELYRSAGNTVEIYLETDNKSEKTESGRQFIGIIRIEGNMQFKHNCSKIGHNECECIAVFFAIRHSFFI